MVRFLFLFATGTGGGFVRTQRTPPPYGPADAVLIKELQRCTYPEQSIDC